MPINVLFSARTPRWSEYEAPLRAAFADAGLDVDLRPAAGTTRVADAPPPHADEEVDYIVCAPNGSVTDFGPFTRTKAVLNLWAGVEAIAPNKTLTQPLARMVDPGLTEGMVEWVTGHVLRHHLWLDPQITGQTGAWRPVVPPLARDRPVTILGMGELGSACAEALTSLRFPVTGWSRRAKTQEGVRCLWGDDGLAAALESAQIVVLLLPLTAQTESLIDARALARLPRGAVLLNPGRGGLIDDDALLAALETGQIDHATLDVFRTEPLPPEHPYWAHPKVTVTPHVASATRAGSASRAVAENIRRGESGAPFLNLVDRVAGY
ncbi:MAG: glyoxylate/hydroxypyruvate reductase A [Rhodobacteraceae bacterium]|nr:glyoxylate/hydroxypyruvate reductase A [Paracoccaceae bacterium]